TGGVHAARKEAVIHDDDGEWTITVGNLHHPRDRQPVAGIIDQVADEFIIRIQRLTDMNLTALILMGTQSIDRKRKNQFSKRWCLRWSKGISWNWRKRGSFAWNIWRCRSRDRRSRDGLTGCKENKNKQ